MGDPQSCGVPKFTVDPQNLGVPSTRGGGVPKMWVGSQYPRKDPQALGGVPRLWGPVNFGGGFPELLKGPHCPPPILEAPPIPMYSVARPTPAGGVVLPGGPRWD